MSSESVTDPRKSVSIDSGLHGMVKEQRIGGVAVSAKSALVVGVRLFTALSPYLNGEIVRGTVNDEDKETIRKALGSEYTPDGKRIRAGVSVSVHEDIAGFRTLEGYVLQMQDVVDRSVVLWLEVVGGGFVDKLTDRVLAESVDAIIKGVLARGDEDGE